MTTTTAHTVTIDQNFLGDTIGSCTCGWASHPHAGFTGKVQVLGAHDAHLAQMRSA